MKALCVVLLASLSFACAAQSSSTLFPKPAASAPMVSCDCTSYPFKPNPPCYGSCVGKLARSPNPDLSSVKGLDPGVSVSIKVLAANPKKETIDFSSITGKSALERAADRSLRDTDLRFQMPMQQRQLEK